jgi:hydroxyethylthiazole kinase-like uncharacterized protein yjeF
MANPQAEEQSGRSRQGAATLSFGGVPLPEPAQNGHKHMRGSVLIVAGGIEGVGAPRLAARMALRIGAGLVTIAAPEMAMAAHAARGPDALMLRRIESAEDLVQLASKQPAGLAVVIGPALGFDARAQDLVAAALGLSCALVLDADALTLMARSSRWRDTLSRRTGATVLTPHEGEFLRLDPAARLSDVRAEEKPALRLASAARMAASCGAIVALKGPGTIVADPAAGAFTNPTGSPALATAGSGDVLAGAIAGLIAQGMPPLAATRAAAWLHGRAGELLGPSLIADDLPEAIGHLRWRTGDDPSQDGAV